MMLRALMHMTMEMLIPRAPMLAACTIARAMVKMLSRFWRVCGSSSPVYASLRLNAWLDWRIEINSASGAIPTNASDGPAGGGSSGGGGIGAGESAENQCPPLE